MPPFVRIQVLLAISVLTAIIARRIRVPHSVGLVIAGVCVHLFLPDAELEVSRNLILMILLPPLVFEAAYALPWRDVKAQMPVVLTFASVGVAISVAVIAGAMMFAGLPFLSATAFAIAVSATDPVSVISIFRDSGIVGRTRTIVEAESLFNDVTVAVLFVAIAAGAIGTTMPWPVAAFTLAAYIGVGLAVGFGVAQIALLLAGKVEDHVVEIAITALAAYGSFWTAEQFGGSGILATVTAGMIVGNRQFRGHFTVRGHESVETFWEFAAFLANSLVFLVIGMGLPNRIPRQLLLLFAVGAGAAVLGRAVCVYGCSALFRGRPLEIPKNDQHILFWGGLRGALAIALVLSLPDGFPNRETILTITYATVSLSVLFQGVTILPLISRLHVPKTTEHRKRRKRRHTKTEESEADSLST